MPSSFNINGNVTSDPLKISERFNDFFSKIGQTIQDNVPSPHTNFTHHMKVHFLTIYVRMRRSSIASGRHGVTAPLAKTAQTGSAIMFDSAHHKEPINIK